MRIRKGNVLKSIVAIIMCVYAARYFLLFNGSSNESLSLVDVKFHQHSHIELDKEKRPATMRRQKLKENEHVHLVRIPNRNDLKEKLIANEKQEQRGSGRYMQEITAERLNRLFDIIMEKEKVYGPILKGLGVASFQDLVDGKPVPALDRFAGQRDEFLAVENGRVRATDKLIAYLLRQSEKHSFESPREFVEKARVEKNKPVIITAANSGYYSPLQATVHTVHKNFPDFHLIVYDLGLDGDQHQMTKDNCNCEVIRFDLNGTYSTISPHTTDLKTYAWKPILIQETLKRHDTVIYIDSSIRFHNNQLQPLMSTLSEVGLLTQYIELKLTCYTNPKQFVWFGESADAYANFFTIEANILFFHMNFLATLMTKAWVTCALDPSCIAPEGSSTGGCCGCHRYDQDALTIVGSFFYAHPVDVKKLPAYSFTKAESFFFQVRRYEGMDYFTRRSVVKSNRTK